MPQAVGGVEAKAGRWEGARVQEPGEQSPDCRLGRVLAQAGMPA